MYEAMLKAQEAYDLGEVPVGAVIVKENRVISKAHNATGSMKDPTAHAEVLAIRQNSTPLCYSSGDHIDWSGKPGDSLRVARLGCISTRYRPAHSHLKNIRGTQSIHKF